MCELIFLEINLILLIVTFENFPLLFSIKYKFKNSQIFKWEL
jgi:hypothetical protein